MFPFVGAPGCSLLSGWDVYNLVSVGCRLPRAPALRSASPPPPCSHAPPTERRGCCARGRSLRSVARGRRARRGGLWGFRLGWFGLVASIRLGWFGLVASIRLGWFGLVATIRLGWFGRSVGVLFLFAGLLCGRLLMSVGGGFGFGFCHFSADLISPSSV